MNTVHTSGAPRPNEEEYYKSPAGVEYRFPKGREIERINMYLARMKTTKVIDKYPAEVDFLLNALSMFWKKPEIPEEV